MSCLSPQAHLLRTYHIVTSPSASTAFLRALLSRRRGMRRLSLRRRRRALLLVPLIELLFLLLFVLLVTLLHWRGRANQRMRLWHRSHLLWRSLSHLFLLRRPEIAVARLGTAIFSRLHVAVLGLLHAVILWLHSTILGLWSTLLLVSARLRLRHLPDLVVAVIRLAEWPKTILRRRPPAALIHLGGLRRDRKSVV